VSGVIEGAMPGRGKALSFTERIPGKRGPPLESLKGMDWSMLGIREGLGWRRMVCGKRRPGVRKTGSET